MKLKRAISALLVGVLFMGLLPISAPTAHAVDTKLPITENQVLVGYKVETEGHSGNGYGAAQQGTHTVTNTVSYFRAVGSYGYVYCDKCNNFVQDKIKTITPVYTEGIINIEIPLRGRWVDTKLLGGKYFSRNPDITTDNSKFIVSITNGEVNINGYGAYVIKSDLSLVDGADATYAEYPLHVTQALAAQLYAYWKVWDAGRFNDEFFPDLSTIDMPVAYVAESSRSEAWGTEEADNYLDATSWDIDAYTFHGLFDKDNGRKVYITSMNGEVTLKDVVDSAFAGRYDLYEKEGADLSGDDFYTMRSQLAFLHLVFDGRENTPNDTFPIGTRLFSEEQQRVILENQVNNLVDTMDSSKADLAEAYWMLNYYGMRTVAPLLAGSADDLRTADNMLETGVTTSQWWERMKSCTQAIDPESDYISDDVFYSTGRPTSADATLPVSVLRYVYSHYHSGITVYQKVENQTSPQQLGKISASNIRPYVLSAQSALSSMSNGTVLEDATDKATQIEIFVQTLYVTYGVMTGILDESVLDNLSFGTSDSDLIKSQGNMLYTPAPEFMIELNKSVNPNGAIYFLLAYNDYRSHIFKMVNDIAPYMTGAATANSTAKINEYKDAIMMMKQMLDVFDDANMWDVWFDKSMDISNGHSMSDIYDYLVASHAFDASMDTGLDGQVEDDFAYFFTDTALSQSMLTGLKQSATFLPMRTNVYDPATWQGKVGTDWLLNYYAKFGYFRKALYIDTNADAAVTFGNTGGHGNLAVATLEDLLQDKDIVLYLDDNLYNVNTLSELIGKAWDRYGQDASTDVDGKPSLGDMITNLWEVSMPELAKTGEKTVYSSRVTNANKQGTTWGDLFFKGKDFVEKKVEASPTPPTEEEEETTPSASPAPTETTTYEASTSSDSISYYLYPDRVWDTTANQIVEGAHTTEYTPLYGFAVLSGVYQNDSLKQTLNSTLSASTPVFVASGTAPYVRDSLRTAIYNYMLCRNLEAQMTVDYTVSMDMTSPIYMDIFGNILTESGYVVIPAAANATLFTNYVPRNAAFYACYGDAFYLPAYDENPDDAVHHMLTDGSQALCSLKDGVYRLNALRTTDMTVNAAMLSTASTEALSDIADTFATTIKTNANYYINKWRMIITEVLRGAPIEYIDKQFEGLTTNVAYTRQGLIIADKLETLTKAIAPVGQNASLAIPNPAFMDGIEIIVFFVYKLLILAVLIIWMVNVYLDATGGTIGLKTGFKCIGVVVLVLALIVGVPKVFELSYYESNKLLLQQETEYLLMLNTEKQANGQEIGVSKVSPPETNTALYLHLADIQMPWWDLLSKIGLSAGYKSLNEMYDDYANKHPLAGTEYATVKNDGIYISVDQLFDSAKVQFSPLSKRMYVAGDKNTPASYYTPYYFFLNCLVEDISNWSRSSDGAVAYTTKVQKGGELKTLGYCRLFFADAQFTEKGGDLFHLYDVYNIQKPRVIPYQAELDPELELAPLRHSQWCNFDSPKISEKGYVDRINRLQKYAQEWIANNHDMIGRVSDETFLKCFALSCAMEHNRLFNTQRADYLEIQELSNEDLLRLSIGDHNTVLSNSSMSYARYVYSTGGTIAVYLAAVLELVNLVGSWVKPACTLLVFCIACISIFVLKLILRRGNNSIMGYILTITLMCSVNVLGAVVTKLSMFLPNTGLTPSICILLQIFVQVIYIMLQFKIVSFALRDWQNVGYQHYEHAYNKIHIGYRQPMLSRNVATPRGTTGYPAYDSMMNTRNSRRLIK